MTFDSWHVPDHLYFITASVCGWKHLFSEEVYAHIILDSLAWLRKEKRMKLYAFVLMPSHLHAIIQPIDNQIGELLQDFGSFTAHAILKQLKNEEKEELLIFFHGRHRDKRSKYSIWQDIQAKNIFSDKFFNQKLEYIHQNPVSKRWKLVIDRVDYIYSTAGFYDCNRTPIIGIDDIREFL